MGGDACLSGPKIRLKEPSTNHLTRPRQPAQVLIRSGSTEKIPKSCRHRHFSVFPSDSKRAKAGTKLVRNSLIRKSAGPPEIPCGSSLCAVAVRLSPTTPPSARSLCQEPCPGDFPSLAGTAGSWYPVSMNLYLRLLTPKSRPVVFIADRIATWPSLFVDPYQLPQKGTELPFGVF